MPRISGWSIITVSICASILPLVVVLSILFVQFDTLPLHPSTRAAFEVMGWAGAIASAVGILGMAILIVGAGRREFKSGWSITLCYAGFLGGIFASGKLPVLGLQDTADSDSALLKVLSILPIIALSIGLGSLTRRLGKRSLRFQRGDGALQGDHPLVWASIFQLIALGVNLGFRGQPGLSEEIGGIGEIVWLVASVLVLVGFLYLIINAIWASLPLLQSQHRMVELLDLPETPISQRPES